MKHRAVTCTNHHDACDCREAKFEVIEKANAELKQEIRKLKSKIKTLEGTLSAVNFNTRVVAE